MQPLAYSRASGAIFWVSCDANISEMWKLELVFGLSRQCTRIISHLENCPRLGEVLPHNSSNGVLLKPIERGYVVEWKPAEWEPGSVRVTTKSGVMIIDCFATWCGPCKVKAPRFVNLSHAHTFARFYKIDVDELSELAQELGVRAISTSYMFKDGERKGNVVGANENALKALVVKELGV